MATAVKLLNSVQWKGVIRKPGETILDFDDGEAKRLAARKALVIVGGDKKGKAADASGGDGATPPAA